MVPSLSIRVLGPLCKASRADDPRGEGAGSDDSPFDPFTLLNEPAAERAAVLDALRGTRPRRGATGRFLTQQVKRRAGRNRALLAGPSPATGRSRSRRLRA